MYQRSLRKIDMNRYHLFINFPFICSLTGLQCREYFSDPKIMMDAQIETYRRLGLPPVLIADYGLATECSAFGAEVLYDNMGFPSADSSIIADLSETLSWKIPDPWSAGLMPKVLGTMEYMKGHAPSDVLLEVSPVSAPFSTAAMLRGISDFCLDLVEEDEEDIRAYLDIVTDATILYLKEQEKIAGKPDHILVADDVSAFVSTNMYSQFVMPCYDRLYEQFPHASRWLHNDAKAAHLAHLISEAGFEYWHIGDSIDMGQAFSDTLGKVHLIGNMSPKLMRTGSAEEVSKETEKLFEKYGSNPMFIAGLGGFINYGTPEENVMAFIRTALQMP